MKITSIKPQVKRQGRYSIFVEGKYCFSLSDGALLESNIINGQDLTDQEIRELKRKSEEDQLYSRALNFATIRPRSTWELQTYLDRKDCPPALAEIILNKLSIIGLVDDEAFARAWVSNRRAVKPTSLRRLNQELRAKRIDEAVISIVLAEEDDDSENTAIIQIIERKQRQSRYKDKQKLMQYLSTQGFSYGDIKDAMSALEED